MNSKELGIKGEVLAVNHLKEKGYRVLDVNWRYKHKEIDIIAMFEEVLCIVEVKTRRSDYISPKESVNLKKQKNLILAANEYVLQKNFENDIRFDVIEIILNQNRTSINHIEDAYAPLIS